LMIDATVSTAWAYCGRESSSKSGSTNPR
jgi:hypothetical protein